MNPILLIADLSSFLRVVLKDFMLETGNVIDRPPQVVEGWLPPKGSSLSEPDDFPYVIVRLCEGEDTEESGTVKVKIIVGTHSEEIRGWEDAGNIIMRIRNALLAARTLYNRYRLELPLTYQLFEDQPYPEWIGLITTIWTVPLPVEQVTEEEDYDYKT